MNETSEPPAGQANAGQAGAADATPSPSDPTWTEIVAIRPVGLGLLAGLLTLLTDAGLVILAYASMPDTSPFRNLLAMLVVNPVVLGALTGVGGALYNVYAKRYGGLEVKLRSR